MLLSRRGRWLDRKVADSGDSLDSISVRWGENLVAFFVSWLHSSHLYLSRSVISIVKNVRAEAIYM